MNTDIHSILQRMREYLVLFNASLRYLQDRNVHGVESVQRRNLTTASPEEEASKLFNGIGYDGSPAFSGHDSSSVTNAGG